MGSVKARLARLEDRARPAARRTRSASERIKDWQARGKIMRRERSPKCAYHARSLIAWLSMTGQLPGSAEVLIERIMDDPHDASGFMQPPETRSRSVVRWEVMRAIYNREDGTAHMQLSGSWRQTFEAGEELCRRLEAMPPERAARWVVEWSARKKGGATDEELTQLDREYLAPFGITEALEQLAVGPDAEKISESEAKWRIAEHTHPVFASPWGWEMHKHASKLQGG
jgi:hypothetical protein